MTRGVRPYLLLILLCLGVYLPGLTVVPPLDRDEARFAQATKQMLESGDFVDIRFQEEPRHKKPVGVYWLQAAAVAAAGGPESAGIWAYRLPSVAGAMAAVLLTFAVGARLFDRRAALLGAAFLAGSLALVLEANQAKTDAVLLATVVAAQWALVRLWSGEPGGADAPAFWVFWIAIAAGILVKGPLAPFVVLLTLIALVISERRWRWLSGLRPLRGISLTVLLVAPWAVAVWIATDGTFFTTAIGTDFAPKLVSGQESHGAPPGYYAALMPAFFWPASLFAVPAAVFAWRQRHEPSVRFCLAWLVPAWLVFELIPTKLPHYVLPLYPALALLAGAAVSSFAAQAVPILRSRVGRLWTGLWVLIGVLLAAAAIAAPFVVGAGFAAWSLVAAAAALAAALVPVRLLRAGRILAGAAAAVLLGGATLATTLQLVLPRLSDMWISPRLAALVAPDTQPPVAVAGLAEPSLVFLLGTDTRLVGGAGAAAWLQATDGAVAAVRDSEETAFRAALGGAAERLAVLGTVDGLNYSKGDRLTLTVYRLQP